MPKVLIVMDADDEGAAVGARMGAAMGVAIAISSPSTVAEICLISELNSAAIASTAATIYPLTLNLPDALVFPSQNIYRACRDVSAMRDRAGKQFGAIAGVGNFWLPVVWTAKGPLYGEVIGLEAQKLSAQPNYSMPVNLSDVWRQQLYELAFQLLKSLSAPPATYLMQFGFQGKEICFDRLWPFPAAPAIASVGVQVPDLFLCHWYCLTNMPIYDLQISLPAIALGNQQLSLS
ncbi:MAG TPA: hypothetical protein VK211_05510 [Kamptonema sp.]|nr:hypothetical protein [Kamptonema sp.]